MTRSGAPAGPAAGAAPCVASGPSAGAPVTRVGAAGDVAIVREADGAATHAAVLAGLLAYNRTFAPPAEPTPLVLAARGPDGALLGGLVGETLWGATGEGWLQVALLWVDAAARGRGLGRALLHAAEGEALARGCRHVALDTFEFQARPFYERAGYAVFAVQEGFPPGHRRWFLRKTLASGAPATAGADAPARAPRPTP